MPQDTSANDTGETAPMTRVLVCGGKNYTDRVKIYDALNRLHAEHHFSMLIMGDSPGAETVAEEWARDRGIPSQIYKADREHWGSDATAIRDERMLKEEALDWVIAFPGGEGTARTVRLARAGAVRVIVWS
jgi:predicted polyphosphate/ATP-dependent NAD kinase